MKPWRILAPDTNSEFISTPYHIEVEDEGQRLGDPLSLNPLNYTNEAEKVRIILAVFLPPG
jgi:hypothetical protein